MEQNDTLQSATRSTTAVDYTKSRPLAQRRAQVGGARQASQAPGQAASQAPPRVPMRLGNSVRRAAPLMGRANLERCEWLRDVRMPGFPEKLRIWLAIVAAMTLCVWAVSVGGAPAGFGRIGLAVAAIAAIWMARKYQIDRSPWRLRAKKQGG